MRLSLALIVGHIAKLVSITTISQVMLSSVRLAREQSCTTSERFSHQVVVKASYFRDSMW